MFHKGQQTLLNEDSYYNQWAFKQDLIKTFTPCIVLNKCLLLSCVIGYHYKNMAKKLGSASHWKNWKPQCCEDFPD